MLTLYVKQIIEDQHCGYRLNRPNDNKMFCIIRILEKNWAANQLFIDFKKDYNLVRSQMLYNTFIEAGTPMKLLKLIKIYSKKPIINYTEILNTCLTSIQ
jgi:hypothetical protein